MKTKLLTIVFIFLFSISNSQGRDNLWMMGYSIPPITGKADIEFSSGAPVITTSTRDINLSLTFANITDNNGNLLFYTNGATH